MVFFIIFFIIYSILVFVMNNVWVLLGFTLFNVALHFVFKIKFKRVLKNLWRVFWFTAIVFAFNLIFDTLTASLIVAWKIVIVTNFSFIFSQAMSPANMATGFAQLFFPLKLFKVDVNEFALMFVIAFNFIEIFSQELKTLKMNLKARHFNLGFKTIFTKLHIILLMFFANLFKRVDSLEMSLKARGYNK